MVPITQSTKKEDKQPYNAFLCKEKLITHVLLLDLNKDFFVLCDASSVSVSGVPS